MLSFFNKLAACCSALATLACLQAEKNFSDVHAAGKMILIFFAAAAAKLCEALYKY